MDPELTKLILGIVGPLATGASLVLVARVNAKIRGRRDADGVAAEVVPTPTPAPGIPTAATNPLDQMREWTEYIPRLVDAAVENATRPLLSRIERYEEHERIFARLIQRLYWWDDGGRPGNMPRLTLEEQRKMGLDLLTDRPPPQPGPEQYG